MQLNTNDKKFYLERIAYLKKEVEQINRDMGTCYSERAKEILAERLRHRKSEFEKCENILNKIV